MCMTWVLWNISIIYTFSIENHSSVLTIHLYFTNTHPHLSYLMALNPCSIWLPFSNLCQSVSMYLHVSVRLPVSIYAALSPHYIDQRMIARSLHKIMETLCAWKPNVISPPFHFQCPSFHWLSSLFHVISRIIRSFWRMIIFFSHPSQGCALRELIIQTWGIHKRSIFFLVFKTV